MSRIGTAQWLVTLGRFDIAITMSILSSHRVAPLKGHPECMKQLYGYVKHFFNAAVHAQMDVPDYSKTIHESQNWMNFIYGNIEEELPPDLPSPLTEETCYWGQRHNRQHNDTQ